MKSALTARPLHIAYNLIALALCSAMTLTINAQQQSVPNQQQRGVPGTVFGKRPRTANQTAQPSEASPATSTAETPTAQDDAPPDVTQDKETTSASSSTTNSDAAQNARDIAAQPNRRGTTDEEETAIVPYYNNFLTNYRLGPEDVISVVVFGQERYSRPNIVVPPDGRISYPLIGAVFVAGRTRAEVEKELTKKFDEYVIDPNVTVSLDKVGSARYSVVGDVMQPGVRLMTRRLSVREAVAEAGGVTKDGNKSKILLVRADKNGVITSREINVAKIERGKAADVDYLVPGDQVVVQGNTLKKVRQITELFSIVSFASIFRGF